MQCTAFDETGSVGMQCTAFDETGSIGMQCTAFDAGAICLKHSSHVEAWHVSGMKKGVSGAIQ
jgi:hypothetical protein